MYGYIYKTTNIINRMIYIGQHRADHFEPDKYLGSGTLLRRAVEKYGESNFKCELICECADQISLDEQEIYWISYYKTLDKNIGYNLTPGGFGGASPRTAEVKAKIGKHTANTRLINDGKVCKRVPIEELESYISQGWKRGCLPYTRSQEFKDRVRATNKNKICISKDDIRTRVNKDQLEQYLADGWIVGWVKEKKTYKVHQGTGPRKAIHKDNKVLVVPESIIDTYIQDGWQLGGLPHSKEWIDKIKRSNKETYHKKHSLEGVNITYKSL